MTTDSLRIATDLFADVVSGVGDDQWNAPTPCTDWSVADLIAHVRDGDRLFAAALSMPGAGLVEAFSAPGALDRIVSLPIGDVPGSIALHLRIVEALVHAWDLARATGQALSAPAALVEDEIAFSEMALAMLPEDARPFAPSVAVPDDADPLDRLAALLGRQVSQRSSIG